MSARTSPPFRADHVGSLLRTQEVLQAREDFAQGRISAAEKRRIEDEGIRQVVRMQEEVGLQSATDGEYRRASWHMDFIYQIGGITKVKDNLTVRFHNEKGDLEFTPAALRVSEKLSFERCIFGEDFEFLKSVAKGTPKLTIPSPSMVHYRGGRAAIDPGVYPTLDAFWPDLAAVYAHQIEALGRARVHVPAARRHEPRLPQRPLAARVRHEGRRRRRAPAPDVHPPDQRGAGEEAGGDARVHAHVSRQLPLLVGGHGQLRPRRRGAVQPAPGRRLLPRVRRRPLRRFRAAAVRAQGQGRGARARHHQEGCAWSARTTSSAGWTRRRSSFPWTSCA